MMETETEQIPSDKKERFGWYLYDFANTAFTVLIVTALFPLFFKGLVVDAFADPIVGEFVGIAFWGYAGAITMLIVALSSPVLGAIADYSGTKRKFVTVYTILCIGFTTLLFFTQKWSVAFGLPIWISAWVIFIIANVGFEGALPFYNAWLPEISDEKTIGRIGGIGYAAGYVGAMLTIIIALVSVLSLGTNSTVPYLLCAIFFLVFSIPAIKFLKERPPMMKRPEEAGKSYVKIGFGRVKRTLKEIKNYQGLPLFMVAYFLLADGITTVIFFAAIFGEVVFSFSIANILIFFAVTQLTAIPGAFIFGYVADEIGTKKTLMFTLIIWIIALSLAFIGSDPAFGPDPMTWWVVGMIAGLGMGSAQSTARSMFGQYIPEEKKSEMFGLYALTGRFAAILGPLLFSLVLTAAGNAGFSLIDANRYALLSILSFFVVAFLILIKVRQPVMGESKIQVHLEDDIRPGM